MIWTFWVFQLIESIWINKSNIYESNKSHTIKFKVLQNKLFKLLSRWLPQTNAWKCRSGEDDETVNMWTHLFSPSWLMCLSGARAPCRGYGNSFFVRPTCVHCSATHPSKGSSVTNCFSTMITLHRNDFFFHKRRPLPTHIYIYGLCVTSPPTRWLYGGLEQK